MAKGSQRYVRDSRGRFASTGSSSSDARSSRLRRIRYVNAYHGTTSAAAASIRRSGFKPSEDGVYGNGVYVGTKAVAAQYGTAMVKVRIPKGKIRDAAGSSRQIRQTANEITPKGLVVRWAHPVADKPHQAAFTLSAQEANKYARGRSGVVRKNRRRR